jgi:hypothetical protein
MAWLLGQMQIRLKFASLALVGLAVAIARCGLSTAPWVGSDVMDRFVLVNFATFAMMIGTMAVALWSAEDVKIASQRAPWKSVLLLSVAGTMIPQFDMFIMHHTQIEADFIDFTRASLFGRALFSLIYMFAQWRLPSQVRGLASGEPPNLWKFLLGLLILCGVVALSSTFVSAHIFGWERVPSKWLVFLSSTEISVLALVFFSIQRNCSQHRHRPAIFLLAVLGLEAAVGLAFAVPMTQFLTAALILQNLSLLYVTYYVESSVQLQPIRQAS